MGNWTMVIHGTGCHHNGDSKKPAGDTTRTDADALLEDYVSDLKKKGHSIQGATITHGGRDKVEV